MKYNSFPNNYNWGIMPNKVFDPNSNGSNEISELLRDIGDEVDMKYHCWETGSGAKDDNIEPAFRNFGYSSATQIGYEGTSNYTDVMNDLDQGYPVVFTGSEKDGLIGLFEVGGHAWVADGYIEQWFCPSGTSTLQFHMNWGWDGNHNGWFWVDEFNPDGTV